jgi:Adenylate and Guanylate cyclase catalytic domain
MAVDISKGQYSPGLFDLTQDIYGGLPIKLVERWLNTGRADDDAVRLLQEYEVQGFSVSSDSAGLTKLTGQKSLLEILALINGPKRIVYAYGAAIGGHGVGIWAADNTQMFYPSSTRAGTLLSALLTMQREITQSCQIRIGLGAHFGNFYHVSGGLYGVEADAIEHAAENDTEGGEIVVSQPVVDRLPVDHSFTLERKEGTPAALGALYRVVDGPLLVDVQPSDGQYPLPYSETFYADLLAYEQRLDDTAFAQYLADKYLRHKTVVLIERQGQGSATGQPDLLDALALSAMMKDVGARHLPTGDTHSQEIKVVGPLGIYLFDEPAAAVRFAQNFRADLATRDIGCRIGVDCGPVLVGELSSGGMEIAGMPVNIASKMAQDVGKPGKIYLSEAIRDHVDADDVEPVQYAVSGIQLTAFEG